MSVEVYVDGSSDGRSGGMGGWGVVLQAKGRRKELSGTIENATNNRAELESAIQALYALKGRQAVTVYSDSNYVVQAMRRGWVDMWSRRGWIKRDKEPVKNQDQWETLAALAEKHDVTFEWVEGHAGNELNELAHNLALAARKEAEAQNPSKEESRPGEDDLARVVDFSAARKKIKDAEEGWPPESIESEEKFGRWCARLYPFLDESMDNSGVKVMTPRGMGSLKQVFSDRAMVVLDSTPPSKEFMRNRKPQKAMTSFRPEVIGPVGYGRRTG